MILFRKETIMNLVRLVRSKLHDLFAVFPFMREQKYGIITAYQECVSLISLAG